MRSCFELTNRHNSNTRFICEFFLPPIEQRAGSPALFGCDHFSCTLCDVTYFDKSVENILTTYFCCL
jgi:hypothetical protein